MILYKRIKHTQFDLAFTELFLMDLVHFTTQCKYDFFCTDEQTNAQREIDLPPISQKVLIFVYLLELPLPS